MPFRIRFFALTIFFVFSAFCLSAAEQDTLEKLPPAVAVFKKGEIQNIPNGKSARFLGPKDLCYTISVFKTGAREIPEGQDSPELKQCFESVLQNRMERHKDTKILKREFLSWDCLAGKKLVGYYAQLVYQDNNRPYYMDLFAGAYRGNLLTVEFAPELPLVRENQEKLSRIFLDHLRRLLYTGEKTSVPDATKRVIYKAVQALEENPLESGIIAAQAVLKFTNDSRDVFVILNEKDLPWLPALAKGSEKEKKYLNLLIASFMGGNIRAQLQENLCGDRKEAGQNSLEKTYRKIRQGDSTFIIKELERK